MKRIGQNLRNMAAMVLYDNGWSVTDILIALNMGKSTFYELLKERREHENFVNRNIIGNRSNVVGPRRRV